MLRRISRPLALLAGTVLLAAASGAPAQPVPPAPLPSVVPMPPVPPQSGDGNVASIGAPRSIVPPANPAQAPRLAKVDPAAGGLTPAQREAVQRVNSYFNSVTSLIGEFVQIGPDRSRIEGDFYLQKPGKVRFDYDAPSPVELISDGRSVVVRDRMLDTQDLYPLSQTPLRFLLAEKLDLLKDAKIVNVYQDDLFINVVIEEEHPIVGTHRLMLMFGARDAELKQWTITDPQGYDTTIAIHNLDRKHRPDPSLFIIDYTRRFN